MSRKTALFLLLSLSACASAPRTALERHPLNAVQYVQLGDVYLGHGENRGAVEQYKEAISLEYRYAPAWMGLGNAAFDARDFKEARRSFQHALELIPDDAGLLNNLAMTELELGNVDRARDLLAQGMPRAGSLRPYLLDTSARVSIHDGHFKEANAALNEAQAAMPLSNTRFTQQIELTRKKIPPTEP